MLQKEIYSQLDKLTKDELIGIIIENQCFIWDEWVKSLNKKELNVPFEKFWEVYDYKKWSKKMAETAWKRLTNKQREDAMQAVPLYVRDRDSNYVCMATTWIHQRRWEWILEEENKKIIQQQKEIEKRKTKFNQWPIPWELKDIN